MPSAVFADKQKGTRTSYLLNILDGNSDMAKLSVFMKSPRTILQTLLSPLRLSRLILPLYQTNVMPYDFYDG